ESQRPDGAIPWFEGGPWDPWNHAECVMALAVMGEAAAARAGLDYLQATQEPDGSWLGGYGNALPMEGRLKIARVAAPELKDANFIAYPALAVWHGFRLTGDLKEARRRWPMVRAAIDFVLSLQHPEGDISWCAEAHGGPLDDAILAGAASIYASLGAAIRLADLVGEPSQAWRLARARLQNAILCAPHRFDRTGTPRSGFAMDAYYPILAGVMPWMAGLARLETRVAPFVEQSLGCRCVLGEPWFTVAESSELAMALVRLGRHRQAQALLSWQMAHRDDDGAFWMGWQMQEAIFWPQEKPSWTQAAVILATDALHGATAACGVLTAD
ncbi:MAG TPA: hypothetical protein VIP08_01750, partial [Phenylobacterium sp.]